MPKITETLDVTRPFDPVTVTRDELARHIRFWGHKTGVVSAYLMIAELRGFEPFTYEEIYTCCETDSVSVWSGVCVLGTRSCTTIHDGEQHDQGDSLDDGNDAVQTGTAQVGTDNG